jgi:hypothetical protein
VRCHRKRLLQDVQDCLETLWGDHQLYPVDTGGSFAWSKANGCEADHLHVVVELRMYEGRLESSWTHNFESEICGGAVTDFFEVPPLANDALLTTLHPLLENVLQTVDHFKTSCLGTPFSRLEKPRNLIGRDLDQWYSTFFPPVPLETLFHSTLYPQSCWCVIQVIHNNI